MPLEKSEAILLKAFNWSESSRTIRFFTRTYGSIALTDKGGRKLVSKRGRPLPFAHLELSYYQSGTAANGYLSDVTLLESFDLTGDGSLGRLAYASAGCELLLQLLPDEMPHDNLFSYTLHFLKQMQSAPKRSLSSLFIAYFLRTLSSLGFHPSLAHCAVCGRPAREFVRSGDSILFSPDRGGLLCPTCGQGGGYYIRWSSDLYTLVAALQTASLSEAAAIPTSHADALLLLDGLAKFVQEQTGAHTGLKSLEFLARLKQQITQDS